jgi:hypothetical protein
MIIELAVERVEFTCGHCWHRWSLDYDVQYYQDEHGQDWEYFYRDGIGVISPYTPDGAPPCPRCGRRWVGHLLARRPVPLPPGSAGTPRHKVTDLTDNRPERHAAPLLGAAAHQQPERQETAPAPPEGRPGGAPHREA